MQCMLLEIYLDNYLRIFGPVLTADLLHSEWQNNQKLLLFKITQEARIGQRPGLRIGWNILQTSIGYYLNTTRSFRCKDNNVRFKHV